MSCNQLSMHYTICRTKRENVSHHALELARLKGVIGDYFGDLFTGHERFLAPLFVIDEEVQRIMHGSIAEHVFHPKGTRLVQRASGRTVSAGRRW